MRSVVQRASEVIESREILHGLGALTDVLVFVLRDRHKHVEPSFIVGYSHETKMIRLAVPEEARGFSHEAPLNRLAVSEFEAHELGNGPEFSEPRA